MSESSRDILVLLGERIKTIRQKKNLSQSDLAYRCDKDRQNIYKVEKGKLNLTTRNLEKIANALEVEVKDLFDFEKDGRL